MISCAVSCPYTLPQTGSIISQPLLIDLSIISHSTSSGSISSLDRQNYYFSLFHSYWNCYNQPSTESDPEGQDIRSLRGRDNIVNAVCPNLHGMFYVKLSLLLTLIGGSRNITEHQGSRRRSQSHLLIVGDPGLMIPSAP